MIIKYDNFDVTVGDIAGRNAVTPKIDHMLVTVLDAIADPAAGTGKAVYRYDAIDASWILVAKSGTDTIEFKTEALVITELGEVQASNIPNDGKIWNVTISDGNVIVGEPKTETLTIVGTSISGLGEFAGKTLRFTYAHGSVVAQFGFLLDSIEVPDVSSIDTSNFVTKDVVINKATLVSTSTEYGGIKTSLEGTTLTITATGA